MLKKFTLFIDKSFQAHELRFSLGLQRALDIVQAIQIKAIRRVPVPERIPHWMTLSENHLHEYFCSGYAENEWLTYALKKSVRIECVFSLYIAPYQNRFIEVSTKGFELRKRTELWGLNVKLSAQTGTIGCVISGWSS